MSETSITAYPLAWPLTRARARVRLNSRFKVPSFAAMRDELMREIERLGAKEVVLSTNLRVRQDGLPYADQPLRIQDPGVAVYFKYKGKPVCFACDRWVKIEDNMQAIHHTIEALRGIARWGTGDMVDAAFSGFAELRAHEPPWRETLGLSESATLDQAEEAFRKLAGEHHPDRGGETERMARLNAAIERARRELGK